MVYLQLFYTFFKIGLFGFGGGAAMLSLIQFEIVENHAWITASEFTNMVAVSQITPGPIGINCATYAGYLATGNVLGSAIATFALVLPSFIIMMILYKLMSKFKDFILSLFSKNKKQNIENEVHDNENNLTWNIPTNEIISKDKPFDIHFR